MTEKNEPKLIQDVVRWEVHPDFTRRDLDAGNNQDYKIGRVVDDDADGVVTAGDGEDAWGVALGDVDTTGTETSQEVMILRHGPAIVIEEQLDFGDLTSGEKATAIEKLEERLIWVRPAGDFREL